MAPFPSFDPQEVPWTRPRTTPRHSGGCLGDTVSACTGTGDPGAVVGSGYRVVGCWAEAAWLLGWGGEAA